jgi:cytochrome c-type biogenesis protein CcmH
MKKQLRIVLYVFILLVLAQAIAILPARAQTPTPPTDDEINAIAHQLFCPICENTPLDVCPTEACRHWRELIRQMLAEGKSETEIKQYFVDNYGARVLSAPPAKGINWLVYIVPPVAFLAGVFLLIQAFRTWRRMANETTAGSSSEARPASASDAGTGEHVEGSGTAAGTHAPDDKYVARLEEELKKRR